MVRRLTAPPSIDTIEPDSGSAKTLELRAACSLALSLARQGASHQGRALLTPLYDAFAEGFDCWDLSRARQVLEQLSA